MISLFGKPKITFECLVPGVERIMPMIPAKDLKHPWVHRAQQELSEMRKSPTWGKEKLVHTAKCPGIFNLQRHGWVMRTWQDITIETYGDGKTFNWTTPIDQKRLNSIANDYIGSHPEIQLANFMEYWRPDTLRTLLKVQSPWRCTVPKGYHLLEMPIPYLDEDRFTTVQGFFSREQGIAQMNPQLLWHVPIGKTLIKAGTPIAQYMLVPKDNFDMDIKVEGTTTEHAFFELANSFRFVKSYGEVKRLFGETK